MEFKELLKQERIKKGYSAKELAREIGVTSVIISNYETGKRLPSPKTMRKIADVLNIDVTILGEQLLKEKLLKR